MTIQWRGRDLYITRLPLASMGRLAACAPQTGTEAQVLAALLAGARVYVSRQALAYRRYRPTAGDGIYTRCMALERRLREMGLRITARDPGR